MIAVDSSSFIAYLKENEGQDVQWIANALENHILAFPPVVITEILSNGLLPTNLINTIMRLPTLAILPDFWSRAGIMRAKVLAQKLKARLADTLIAQSCIDHGVPLITRDTDFRHFVKYADLILFEGP